jgi:hypothetical protein
VNTACCVENCTDKAHARNLCNRHYIRWRKHGDPLRVDPSPQPPVLHGSANPKWKGDNVKYSAVHNRLHRSRGKASEHLCQCCGNQAEDWAYDRSDPSEKVDQTTGFPYSVDPAHYMPLCKPCHWKFDRAGVA